MTTVYSVYLKEGPQRASRYGRLAGYVSREESEQTGIKDWLSIAVQARLMGLIGLEDYDERGFELLRPVGEW